MARFGYRYFDPPAQWREQRATEMRAGDRWLIHSAPGQAFQAEAERIVGGYAGCQAATGVLLRVVPEQSEAFTALPAKYFLAERSTTPPSSKAASSSTVRGIASPSTAEFRRALESTLDALLARELPRVRRDAAPELTRMASSPVSYHRSWARQQQAVEEAMQAGHGKLTYDIQSFRLAPDGVPLHFVRAEWTVRQRQGFAASLWLRGEEAIEAFDTNLQPASWLRMFEFQGKVAREHLRLVLNVFDSDHDGWGRCSWPVAATNQWGSPCSNTRQQASSPQALNSRTGADVRARRSRQETPDIFDTKARAAQLREQLDRAVLEVERWLYRRPPQAPVIR